MPLIRPATRADLPALGRVHSLARAAAYVDLLPAEGLARVTPERQEQVWRERWDALPDRHALLVAEQEGEVVGFTLGVEENESLELRALHTMPSAWGNGTGQALHDTLLAEMAPWGHDRVGLWVLRGNERAQAFYRRNGWTHDGTTSAHEVGGVVVPILRYRRSLP